MTRTDEAFEYLEMILNEHKLCQRLLDENIRLENAIKNIKAEIKAKASEHVKYSDCGRKEDGLYEALDIIEQAIKECDTNDY